MKNNRFNQFKTVLSYEFGNITHSKGYRVTMVIVSLLLVIAISIPAIIQTIQGLNLGGPQEPTDDPASTVYIIDRSGNAPALETIRAALPDLRLATAEPAMLETLRSQVDNGEARGVFVIESPAKYTAIIKRAGVDDAMPAMMYGMMESWYKTQQMAALGLSEAEINTMLTPAELVTVETVSDIGKSMEQTYLSTYVLLMLLYMTVMIYGQMVATSVASEKSNRSMEMLITSADPMSLMFGKVIGSGLAGLFQITVFILTAFIAYQFNADYFVDIPMVQSAFALPLQTLAMTLLFYLLGYFMYAFIFGALGSLVSRTEDINTSTTPITLLFVAGMMISFIIMVTPDSTLSVVSSMIPFFAPMTMFVRMSMTNVPLIQVIISILLMLATIFGLGWLSARIYRIGVLMYGKPPHLRELVKILKSESASVKG